MSTENKHKNYHDSKCLLTICGAFHEYATEIDKYKSFIKNQNKEKSFEHYLKTREDKEYIQYTRARNAARVEVSK